MPDVALGHGPVDQGIAADHSLGAGPLDQPSPYTLPGGTPRNLEDPL